MPPPAPPTHTHTLRGQTNHGTPHSYQQAFAGPRKPLGAGGLWANVLLGCRGSAVGGGIGPVVFGGGAALGLFFGGVGAQPLRAIGEGEIRHLLVVLFSEKLTVLGGPSALSC